MPTPIRPHLFPAALASLMQECDVNQVRLSQETGIAVSRINNYLQGRYRSIRLPHVEAMFHALDGSPASKAAYAQAYLFDLIPEKYRGLLDIRMAGVKESGKWAVPSKGLPKDFAEALSALYVMCASSVKVREYTKEWIDVMRDASR